MALQAVDEARADEIRVFEPRMLSHSFRLGQFTDTVFLGWFYSLDWTTGLTFLPLKIIFMPCN